MPYERELLFFRRILRQGHLQSLLIDPEAVFDERMDMGLRRLVGAQEYKECFCDYFEQIDGRTVYRVTDAFLCHYIFMLLPDTDTPTVLLIGPYVTADLTHEQILELGERLRLPPAGIKQLDYYYTSLPAIREEGSLNSAIMTLAEHIWQGEFTTVDIDRDRSAAFVSLSADKATALSNDSNFSMQVMEKRYEYESDLLEAVSKGHLHKAEQMLARFSTLSFENRLQDNLRNTKNYLIIMNTLLRKAAQNGGVHPVYLDKISSEYAKQIERIASVANTAAFMHDMLRTYCRLVAKHAIGGYSPLIQQTIIKIDSDLTADLTLKSLSALNNVSSNYLSGLFKKDTGQTLTEFVNQRRISAAKRLLRTTNLQVQTVAQHCGILDVHYFSKLFKRYVGVTPKEYRDAVQH